MPNKSPAFQFYPDKWLAGTDHLSEKAYKAYHKMCCRIWLHTPTQFSFDDKISVWKFLTGISDDDLIQKIKNEIMNPVSPLFKFFKKKPTKLFSNALKKEKKKQLKRRRQTQSAAKAMHAKRKQKMQTQCERSANASPPQCPPSPSPSPFNNLKDILSFPFPENDETKKELFSLLKRYDNQRIIGKAFMAIASTRKYGKVSLNIFMAQLRKWDGYSIHQVYKGINIYLGKDCHKQGLRENYLLGIIRNEDTGIKKDLSHKQQKIGPRNVTEAKILMLDQEARELNEIT